MSHLLHAIENIHNPNQWMDYLPLIALRISASILTDAIVSVSHVACFKGALTCFKGALKNSTTALKLSYKQCTIPTTFNV